MALIYVVEDDPSIREIEEFALRNSNYEVLSFERASSFWKKMDEMIPDLILLDVMLPDMNGYDIVKKIRRTAQFHKIPVIMVTAKTSEIDMVKGLDGGADDYIRKPFSILEMLSRVKAILRRTMNEEEDLICVGDIQMDHIRRIVRIKDEVIPLTFKEYELLRYLMMNAQIVLSREAIMRFVWDTDFEGETRTVDMHIKTLRQKMGDYGRMIKTVRNVGYVLQEKGD